MPQKVIIFEGIMIYSDKRIRELIDLKIFVDTPADVRFIRRMKRDIEERGRTVDSVVKQYLEVVRPGHIEVYRTDQVLRRPYHSRGRLQSDGP